LAAEVHDAVTTSTAVADPRKLQGFQDELVRRQNDEWFEWLRRLKPFLGLGLFRPVFLSGATNPILDSYARACLFVTHSSTSTLTFSAAASEAYQPGDVIAFCEFGTGGRLTLSPAAGVTVHTPETLITRKQYSIVFILKLRAREWITSGDMELF
jgi:hypothetical protein